MKYLKIYALLALLLMAGGVTIQAQVSRQHTGKNIYKSIDDTNLNIVKDSIEFNTFYEFSELPNLLRNRIFNDRRRHDN